MNDGDIGTQVEPGISAALARHLYDGVSERVGRLGAMRRLLTPAWLARHVLAVALVCGFLALGWWQIGRAASGNALSWAYAFEWPVFAGFVVFMWVREARHTLRSEASEGSVEAAPLMSTAASAARRPVRTTPRRIEYDDSGDPELAEYNRYLAWLNANPGAKPADFPG